VIGAQEYGDGSCGVRALNRLCHWLNVLGHDASIASTARWQRQISVHPEWEVKPWDSVMTEDTIAIYPDAYAGNPYHANRVVRWALYHPGLRAGQATFSSNERVYYYADLFRASVRDAVGAEPDGSVREPKRLYVNVFEPHYLYAEQRPKLYDAFWVGRGLEVAKAHLHSIGAVHDMYEFQVPFRTRAEFARALRRVGWFYSFDPCSAMIPEAALCGARTFHIAADGAMRELGHDAPEMLHAFDDLHAFNKAGDVSKFCADMEAWS
jgi:hypothetical protein